MIGRLIGEIIFRKPNLFIVNVNGIGYNVHVPLSTYFNVAEDGSPVTLEIYTHVKEDSISLYGFLTAKEKVIFEKLISISGIGPRLAINMMSGIDLHELIRAISAHDVDRLRAIPGIGKKTAERVVLELKDKLSDLPEEGMGEEAGLKAKILDMATKDVLNDAISALTNLGFKSSLAKNAVENSFVTLKSENPAGSPQFQDIFRKSLKLLMKR